MPTTLRYPRFEIRIDTDKGSVTHISSAQTQAEAIERVMRVYEGKNPVLSNVKPSALSVKKLNKRSWLLTIASAKRSSKSMLTRQQHNY